MREPIRDRQRLEHILTAIHTIVSYRNTYTEEELAGNPITFFGFVKHLEIIGEAAYKLTKEFKAAHPDTDWTQIEGMRHVMVHGYYLIDPSIVISTLRDDIDQLNTAIRRYISEY